MQATNRNQNPIYLKYADGVHARVGLTPMRGGMVGEPGKEGGQFVPAPIRVPEIIPHHAPPTPTPAPVEVPAKPVEIPAGG